jgi:hypothetical protein
VIEEELREVTEILAVNLLQAAVQLEHAHVLISVNFGARGVAWQLWLCLIVLQLLGRSEKSEGKFAEIKHVDEECAVEIFLGERAEIPTLHEEFPESHIGHVFDLGDLLMLLQLRLG